MQLCHIYFLSFHLILNGNFYTNVSMDPSTKYAPLKKHLSPVIFCFLKKLSTSSQDQDFCMIFHNPLSLKPWFSQLPKSSHSFSTRTLALDFESHNRKNFIICLSVLITRALAPSIAPHTGRYAIQIHWLKFYSTIPQYNTFSY